MAKTNISFDNKTYSIDDASLSSATTALRQHLSTTMNGTGATIGLGGTNYNIDSTKLSTATNAFVAHLGTIAGNGSKVVVNGREYGIDSAKVAGVIADLHTVFGGLHSGDDSNDGFPIAWNTVDVADNYSVGVGESVIVKISDALPPREDLEKLHVSEDGLLLSFEDYVDDMCIGNDVVTANYTATVYNDDGGSGYTWHYLPVTVVYKAGNYSGIEIGETGLYVLDIYNMYQENKDCVIDYFS